MNLTAASNFSEGNGHNMAEIGILGAGAWGTALAQVAATAGHTVCLWALEPEVLDSLAAG
jgi:glycerol-3-phosphate dehydrogenase (NAD(P)+)